VKRLKRGQKVQSPVSGKVYEIVDVLGEGGFGAAYRAWELNRRGKRYDEVCIKVTLDQTSWHRESYFGELLSRSKRAIQMLDTFPLAPKSKAGRMAFCLVLELAEHGTIVDYLEATGRPWGEKRAVRETVALLKLLDQLHGGSATHRDLTPMNVFVTGKKGALKLGDFGIARHALAGAPQTIDAFNPAFVTQGFLTDEHRYWRAVDDVFQMGQLLCMLLRGGDPELQLKPKDVAKLGVSADLQRVLERAIGPRKQRYQDAYELMQALEGEPDPEPVKIRSLKGKTVVFTGPLSIRRFDAEVLVCQAGGAVAGSMTKDVDVVVQGGRSPNYKDGHKGTKLKKAEQLRKKGQKIAILSEAQFRRLVREKD